MAGNPAFSNSPAFSRDPSRQRQADMPGAPAGYPQQAPWADLQPGTQTGAPQQGQPGWNQRDYWAMSGGYPAQGAQPGQLGADPSSRDLQQQFDAPASTERLTLDRVMNRTVLTLGSTALGFVVGMGLITMTQFGMVAMIVAAIAGFVLGLVNVFKKEPSPGLILGYGLAQGVFLGGFSALLEWGMNFNGIIFQALIATAAVFFVTLVLYSFRIVRATPKMTKIFMFAALGYIAFSLVNLVLMLTGISPDPWGLRGAEIAGFPVGIIIGVLAVVLGAYSLVMDFTGIEEGIKRGVHKKYAWTAAFGITMTIIWLYLEIIRMIAIARSN